MRHGKIFCASSSFRKCVGPLLWLYSKKKGQHFTELRSEATLSFWFGKNHLAVKRMRWEEDLVVSQKDKLLYAWPRGP